MAKKIPYAGLVPENYKLLFEEVDLIREKTTMHKYLLEWGYDAKKAIKVTSALAIIRREEKRVTMSHLYNLIPFLTNETIAILAMDITAKYDPNKNDLKAEEALEEYKKYLPEKHKTYWKRRREVSRKMALERSWSITDLSS